MAAVTESPMEIAAHIPSSRTVLAGNTTIAVNSAEPVQLGITVGDQFRQLRLVSLSIRSVNAATLPGYQAGERCIFQFRKRSQGGNFPHIASDEGVPAAIDGNTALDSIIWTWDTRQFLHLPNILPGDGLFIATPILDDNVSPAADLLYRAEFLVVDY